VYWRANKISKGAAVTGEQILLKERSDCQKEKMVKGHGGCRRANCSKDTATTKEKKILRV